MSQYGDVPSCCRKVVSRSHCIINRAVIYSDGARPVMQRHFSRCDRVLHHAIKHPICPCRVHHHELMLRPQDHRNLVYHSVAEARVVVTDTGFRRSDGDPPYHQLPGIKVRRARSGRDKSHVTVADVLQEQVHSF